MCFAHLALVSSPGHVLCPPINDRCFPYRHANHWKKAITHTSLPHREVGGAIPVPLDTLKPLADSIATASAPPVDVLAMAAQPLVAAGVLAPAQVGALGPLVGQLQYVFGEVCVAIFVVLLVVC